MGNITGNIIGNRSEIPRNVRKRSVYIYEADLQASVGPVAANFSTNNRAPVNDAYGQPQRNEIFEKYHEACVKVIAANASERRHIQGSGVLFKASEAQIVLVTAAHVLQGNSNVKIVLEIGYKPTSNTGVRKASKITINLRNHLTQFGKETDIACITLSKDDSKYILSEVNEFPYPSLDLHDYSSDRFMIIYYSDGGRKKKYTGERERIPGNHQPLETRIHMPGGEGASGAPIFNYRGDVVAIHRSRAMDHPEIRNVTPVQFSNLSSESCYNALEIIFELTEGRKFNDELEINEGKFKPTVFKCLGVGGKHGYTKRYSTNKDIKIDSDHFPPYDAYKRACNIENCFKTVKAFFRSWGKKQPSARRPGENHLPAITIPKVFHKELATTGSSTASENFRQSQAEFIAANAVFRALRVNFNDYHEKGLFKRSNYQCTNEQFNTHMGSYVKGFDEALTVHVELGFITPEQREELEDDMLELATSNYTGEDLDSEDMIEF